MSAVTLGPLPVLSRPPRERGRSSWAAAAAAAATAPLPRRTALRALPALLNSVYLQCCGHVRQALPSTRPSSGTSVCAARQPTCRGCRCPSPWTRHRRGRHPVD
eukprot:353851-Chlamydomonas_euryale.AAC.6